MGEVHLPHAQKMSHLPCGAAAAGLFAALIQRSGVLHARGASTGSVQELSPDSSLNQ